MTWILASDIDGTLTGDEDALKSLGGKLQKMRSAGELVLILCTGRRLEQVIDGFASEYLPEPDAVICQVGTEIYCPPFSPASKPMEAWDTFLKKEFAREEALRLLEGIESMELQPSEFNTDLKVSCYLDKAPDPDKAAAVIAERASGVEGYQVVWSSGRDLDILPASSGKGKAVRFMVGHLGLDPGNVVVAGDTGNDLAMFREFGHGVAVGNAKTELRDFAASHDSDKIYLAKASYAAGVAEGLEHLGILSS